MIENRTLQKEKKTPFLTTILLIKRFLVKITDVESNYIKHIQKKNLYYQEYFMMVLMVRNIVFFKKDKGRVKSEPEYAYKRYAYMKSMYIFYNIYFHFSLL